MKCEKIQQNLLDYGKGLLSGSEAKEIKTHLAGCAECRDLLMKELAFSKRLSIIPDAEPDNDVWALVRAQIRPRRASFGSVLSALVRTNIVVRRTAAATLATIVAAVVITGLVMYQEQPKQTPNKSVAVNQTVGMKWSDDPMGSHSDTMVSVVDDL